MEMEAMLMEAMLMEAMEMEAMATMAMVAAMMEVMVVTRLLKNQTPLSLKQSLKETYVIMPELTQIISTAG